MRETLQEAIDCEASLISAHYFLDRAHTWPSDWPRRNIPSRYEALKLARVYYRRALGLSDDA